VTAANRCYCVLYIVVTSQLGFEHKRQRQLEKFVIQNLKRLGATENRDMSTM
jgi:hypothetical protein